MSSRQYRSIVPFLATLITASPLALAQVSGLPESVTNVSGSSTQLEQASKFSQEGQLVRAQSMLKQLVREDASTTLNDAQRTEAFNLLADVERRIGRADRYDISVQKAAMAVEEGDLRKARKLLKGVIDREAAGATVRANAQRLLADANTRLNEIQPQIPEMIARAEQDFKQQRYAEAKAGFDLAYKSDAPLLPSQQETIDRYLFKIVDLEQQTGKTFDTSALMSVMQPGQVRRPGDQAPAQPEAAPSTPPEPLPDSQPAASQPAPVPPPETAPNAGDVVRQSMQIDAQRILAEADQAMNVNSFNEAARKYRQLRDEYGAYLTAEQISRIDARLQEAEVRLGSRGTQPGDQLGDEINVRNREKQRVLAEYNNFLDQARRGLESGDVERARGQTALARLSLNSGRNYFAESELDGYLEQTRKMEADIATSAEAIRNKQAQEQEKTIQDDATAAANRQGLERAQRIDELLKRARAFQSELRYEEALQAVEQLLFMDPNNPSGLLLRDVYEDIIIFRKYNAIRDRKNTDMAGLRIDAAEAAQPPRYMMNYPADWPAISFARGEQIAFAETPENRQVLAKLDQKRVPKVEFENNTLSEVVEFVKSVADANVDANWAALDAVNVSRDTQISLNLTNVTVRALMDRLVGQVNATSTSKVDWAVEDGVILLSSDEAIRQKTSLNIYDVRDLLVDVPDYDRVPTIDLQSTLQSGQGGGGQSPFRDNQQNEQTQREQRRREREQRLDDLIDIIQENIDEDWIDNGGSTGRIQKMSVGTLIITNTPKAHRRVTDLLSKLRAVRAMQINVETRFLLVNQDFFEQVGIDIDVYFNANNNQVRVARGADRSIQSSDFFNNGRLNRVLTGQVGPNAATNAPAGTQLTQAVVNPRSTSPIGVTQDSLGLATNIAPASDWAQSILDGAPALGIAGQFLDDIQVDFLVTATQADRRSIQLTAPRVTFTNGQTSNIFVATQRAFVSDLEPVVGDSAVGFDPEVDVVTEGVTLLVNGTVTSDRRYVTMNIETGISRIDGFAQQAVTAVAGGQLVNSADTQSFIQLPTVTVTSVRTTVTVPDQGTLLLGGQRLTTEFEVETGVPVLSKIPVINRFFTNRIESKEEQTLLILVKPTILIQNEQEEKNFPGLIERMRTGFGG